MNRRKLYTILGVVCLALILALPAMTSSAGAPKEYRGDISASGVGTTGYIAAGAIARVISQYNPNILLTATAGPSGTSRMRTTSSGETTIGYVGMMDLRQAALKEGPFKDQPLNILPYKGLVTPSAVTWLVTKADRHDIKTVNDLVGKRVCFAKDVTYFVTVLVHGPEGLNLADKMNPVQIDFNDIGDALVTGRIDATVTYASNFGEGGFPPWMLEVAKRQKIKPVLYTEEQAQKIAKIRGTGLYYMSTKIFRDAGSDVPEGKIPTFLQTNGFVFSPSLDEDTAYKITKTCIEHGPELAQLAGLIMQPYRDRTQLDNTLKNYMNQLTDEILVHPGAAKAYKELLSWDDKWKIGKVK